jgi:hypothetical protein
MDALLNKTQRHLAKLQEPPPVLEPQDAGQLPVFLRQRFRMYRTKLFGREWVLALEAQDWEVGVPNEYRQQIAILADALKSPVVLVMVAANAALRNRLVRLNVPFIVPGTQVYLPMVFVDLRDRYGQAGTPAGKRLSPTAQVVVLYQILRGELAELSSKEIAGKLECSAMMITKVRAELETNGICEVHRVGRETRMTFPGSTKAVWARALSVLASPVAKKRWIQWDRPIARAKIAGISALSRRGMLSDDDVPAYALGRQDFQKLLERGEIRGWPDRDGADACIECWSYEPALLSDDAAVDPLSLFLSLREEHDERVQGELEAMLESIQWR